MSAREARVIHALEVRWKAEAGTWGADERATYAGHIKALFAPLGPAVVEVEIDERPHQKWLDHGICFERLPDRTTLRAMATVRAFARADAAEDEAASRRFKAAFASLPGELCQMGRDEGPAVVTEAGVSGLGRGRVCMGRSVAPECPDGAALVRVVFVGPDGRRRGPEVRP